MNSLEGKALTIPKPPERRKNKSIQFFQSTCDRLNKVWFSDKLRFMLTVGDHGGKHTLAYVNRPDDDTRRRIPVCVITITPKMFYFTEEAIEAIMLHELCHVAQYHHGLEGGHGASMKRIGKMYDIPDHIIAKKIPQDQL